MPPLDLIPSPDAPIGLFDSGFGGFSVLLHLRAALPSEHFIYFADNAHLPYGDKDGSYIRARAAAIGQFLLDQGCKAIVIACNTATAAAAETLRSMVTIPVIAIEPALKPAAMQSKTRKVGVLATEGTMRSERMADLLSRFGQEVMVYQQACPGLADQVEMGQCDAPETRALLRRFLAPMLEAGVDTIVLGCTHYPFLRRAILNIAGDGVSLVDAGEAVARQTLRRLAEIQGLQKRDGRGALQIYASAIREHDDAQASTLLSAAVTVTPVAV